jgi:hypothetical protein
MSVSLLLSRTCAMVATLVLLLLGGCASSLGPGGAPATPISPNAQQSGSNITVAQGAPGIGGTGKQDGKSPGIGGTGQIAGSTPGIGGTGIIGTVTGFGSIFVNGFEVDFAPDLPVTFKDRTVRPNALRIGQVVAIEAEGSGKRLRARRLTVRHEVAGPIERIDPARRMASVFGQRIEIPSGVISVANGSRVMSINDLAVGDHIDVSGLRRANGVIAASRIVKTRPGEAAVLRGRVTATGPDGFSVNGMRIDAPIGIRPATLGSGQDVQIIGTVIRGRLRARRINQLALSPFSGRVRRLSVEGYMRRAIAGGAAIGRIPITQLPARARIQTGQRVILDGSVGTRGRFAPTRLRKPQVNLRFQGEPRRNLNPRPTPPSRQVRPQAPLPPPPVIRNTPPPRPPVYRPPPRRPAR